MKAIGFKNFRKFEDFPIMEMGDITMFVGGNNSGKSTTVKAIISILTFLRNARFYASGNSKHVLDNNFYFNENPYAHIGTFKRAKCNKNDLNELSFEIQIEDYLFSVFLDGSGCDENTAFAKIQRIILKDLSSNFIFNINICSFLYKIFIYSIIFIFLCKMKSSVPHMILSIYSGSVS